MGIHDRDYMRSRSPSRLHAPRTWTGRMVLINLAVFAVLNVLLQNRISGPLVLSLDALASGRIWTLFTAAFLHADAMHIVFNLLALWFLGLVVEEALGSRRFLRFYLLACVLSWIPFLLAEALVGSPRQGTIGASGAVMACIVCAALYRPQDVIVVFFIPMRIWVFGAICVVANALGLLGTNVNYGAHFGGAMLGYLQYRYALADRVPGAPAGFRMPTIRRGAQRAAPSGPTPPLRPETRPDDVRERVDDLLDKISREGIGSLTDDERAFLKDASKRY